MQRNATTSGFTLVELMVTIAIVAVLAGLATVGYMQWIYAAKTGEATSMIAAIQNGQETYFADMQQYLNVSNTNQLDGSGASCSPTFANFYPSSTPNRSKAPWNTGACAAGSVCGNFNSLNIGANASVLYRYASIAGPSNVAPPALGGRTDASSSPWYEIEAGGDVDGNGVYGCYFASSMMKAMIWSVNGNE